MKIKLNHVIIMLQNRRGEMSMDEFGFHLIIKKIRSEKNLTQQDLAELLLVSRQTISKWERNLATPDFNSIKVLSQKFPTYFSSFPLVRHKDSTSQKKEHVNQFINIASVLFLFFILLFISLIALIQKGFFEAEHGYLTWILLVLISVSGFHTVYGIIKIILKKENSFNIYVSLFIVLILFMIVLYSEGFI